MLWKTQAKVHDATAKDIMGVAWQNAENKKFRWFSKASTILLDGC
jgi:hypothetical protein